VRGQEKEASDVSVPNVQGEVRVDGKIVLHGSGQRTVTDLSPSALWRELDGVEFFGAVRVPVGAGDPPRVTLRGKVEVKVFRDEQEFRRADELGRPVHGSVVTATLDELRIVRKHPFEAEKFPGGDSIWVIDPMEVRRVARASGVEIDTAGTHLSPPPEAPKADPDRPSTPAGVPYWWWVGGGTAVVAAVGVGLWWRSRSRHAAQGT